ncbi:Nsp1-like C-terminal region-domain-containing protein [Infundibulicybe gibba]|nr:Nsp1-like C-terminal region-domain-containing protein [Infundibulicybe gibba]
MFGNPSANTNPTQQGNIFGGGATTGSGNNATPNNIFGAKPAGGGLFGGTATGTTATTGGLFGGSSSGTQNKAPSPSSLFGGTNSNTAPSTAPTNSLFPPSSSTNATSPAPNSLFGGFGSSTPSSSNPLFGGASATTGGLSINKPGEQGVSGPSTSGSLFGGSSAPTTGAASAATATTGFSLFSKPADGANSTSAAGPSTSTGTSGGLFGGKPSVTPTPGASLLGANKDATSPGATAPAASNLFGGSKPDDKKDATAASKDGEKPAGTTGIYSRYLQVTRNNLVLTQIPGPASTTTGAISNVVSVPPPSMLRGKTIEEIVNKWSAELDTHVREFSRFAGEVAVWDRALIENGKNLGALYSHVLAAEREQTDIDQSLDHIEQQQKDLSSTLDAYEKATEEILGGQGGGLRALDTGPADTERDKNYMLATDLHTHLDDLSGSLTQMIDSVNALTSTSNSTDGQDAGDDPMAQIAQILSSHLESLQWIDAAVHEVEGKVTEVEKRVQDSGHNSGAIGSKSRSFGLAR